MSLTPFTSNLGVSRAKYLLRRACFHYNKNLLYTILTIPDNSENSNKSFIDKLPIYRINNMPFITLGDQPCSVTAYDIWDATSINTRQKALSKIAKDIWGF